MTCILVCGGRDFRMTDGFAGTFNWLLGSRKATELIHGDARGADREAAKLASAFGIPVKAYPADWNKHGRAAGPIRNQRMLDEGKPDIVIAFPGGGGGGDGGYDPTRKGLQHRSRGDFLMATMIERVARAICEEEWGKRSWSLVSNHSRNKALRHARAAIEAMREPTDVMVDAAERTLVGTDTPVNISWSIFTGMIDAALAEEV